jgi:hypothetical protein
MVRGSAWCVGSGRILRRLRVYASDKLARAVNYMLRTPPDMRFVPLNPLSFLWCTQHTSHPVPQQTHPGDARSD